MLRTRSMMITEKKNQKTHRGRTGREMLDLRAFDKRIFLNTTELVSAADTQRGSLQHIPSQIIEHSRAKYSTITDRFTSLHSYFVIPHTPQLVTTAMSCHHAPITPSSETFFRDK